MLYVVLDTPAQLT